MYSVQIIVQDLSFTGQLSSLQINNHHNKLKGSLRAEILAAGFGQFQKPWNTYWKEQKGKLIFLM